MIVAPREYVHPEDQAALENLKSIPLFSACLKAFMNLGIERFVHGISMAQKIRLSPEQLPEIYRFLPPARAALGIPEPEFYLELYLRQADAYDKLLESNWDKILQGMAVMHMDHPFLAVRAREIVRWGESEQFRRIRAALDQAVTEDEVAQQVTRVVECLKKLEASLSPAVRAVATDALSELAVLYALERHRSLQV